MIDSLATPFLTNKTFVLSSVTTLIVGLFTICISHRIKVNTNGFEVSRFWERLVYWF